MDRNSDGLKKLVLFMAALTYAGAVIYGDVMFLQIVSDTFMSGILGNLAWAGAITTAASALALPLALHFWFAPGVQFWGGIIFWLLDVAVLALNAMLAYALASGGPVDPLLAGWHGLSPATPLLAVVGWGVMFLLDPSHKLRHAIIGIKADQIDAYEKHLKAANHSDEVYAILEAGAMEDAKLFSQMLTSQRVRQTPNVIEGKARDVEPPAKEPGLAERIKAVVNGRRPALQEQESKTDAGANPTPPPPNHE